MPKIPTRCTFTPLNSLGEFVVFQSFIKVSSLLFFLSFFLHNFGFSSFNGGFSLEKE